MTINHARKTGAIAGLLFLAVIAMPVMAVAQVQGSTPSVPTFAKDVAPILQRSCQNCHREGSIAPMSLRTYENVRPWARSIKERVSRREMPPWYIDRTVGIRKFKNDISLTDSEIATIVNWVDGGAPMGNPADMPPPRQFPDAVAWQLGTPDLIVEMAGEKIVKAKAPDWWGQAGESAGPAVTEDRWAKAIETKPIAGYAAVHHSSVSLSGDRSDNSGGSLGLYVIGKGADVYPEGSGRLVPAGRTLKWGSHLHSTGKETAVKMAAAFQFYPRGYVPKYVWKASSFSGDTEHLLDIPANTDNVRTDTYIGLKKPTVITAFEPHMHNRGKAQCVEALYPPGTTDDERSGGVKTETLSCTDRFNFGWLLTYVYADDVAPVLPAGTILHITSWHNNTATNKLNYDSTNWIGMGERTIDDMSHIWINYYELTEEEYQQRVAARASTQSN